MKMTLNYIFSLFVITFFSCTQTSNRKNPVEDPAKILRNLLSVLEYNRDYLRLSEDFIALDVASQGISKEQFLKLLSSGKYLPLRLISKDSSINYKLYKLRPEVNDDIRAALMYLGNTYYRHYKMEGEKLPSFNFVDLEGNAYNSETTKEKIIVLNFWFIRCQACREEMPALNKLVKQYKNRKDILFVSLALDSEKDLKDFLTKTTFNYSVVSDQKTYLTKDFGVLYYPTQVVINKAGLIIKVVNNYKEMIPVLYRESLK